MTRASRAIGGTGISRAASLTWTSPSWLMAVIALLLVGAAACGTQAPAPGGPSSTGASSPAAKPTEPRLWIKEKGGQIPFENGRSVQVDGADVEIFVSPYPPTRTANVDFYVTRDGLPVEGAYVTLQYDMTVMDHGPFQLLAVPTGRGHFLAPLEFAMSGDFWINVSVNTPSQEWVINLLMRATR